MRKRRIFRRRTQLAMLDFRAVSYARRRGRGWTALHTLLAGAVTAGAATGFWLLLQG